MKKQLKLMCILFVSLFSFTFVSCGDDNESSSGISWDSEEVIGTWEIVSISGTDVPSRIKKGGWLTFYKGYCFTEYSMEDNYVIEGDRIRTFYSKTKEPMFIYTLIKRNGDSYLVRMDGTLDDTSSALLTLKKYYTPNK